MQQLIIKKKLSIIKIITGVLVTLWTVNPFYTMYFNWLIIFKIIMIFWCFGFAEFYYFSVKKEQFKIITFLKFPVLKQLTVKPFPETISIYKPTSSNKYQLYLYANRKKEVILITKNYSDLCLKAKEISLLLDIDFYNPYESYD